jgi:predicted nuclease of predicted toxin-antitoxin system
VRFLIDAQLPRRMAGWLHAAGGDGLHTLDLPAQNRTPDAQVSTAADSEGRIVVTKDADFVDSHLLKGQPQRLLLVSTGNISNQELELLMVPLIPDIMREFQSCRFIELTRTGLILRG